MRPVSEMAKGRGSRVKCLLRFSSMGFYKVSLYDVMMFQSPSVDHKTRKKTTITSTVDSDKIIYFVFSF